MPTILRKRPRPVAAPVVTTAKPVVPVPVKSAPVRLATKSLAELRAAAPTIIGKIENESGYMATIKRYASKVRNPLTAIRAKCVECSGGSLKEVTECRIPECPLYPFREGHNPLHKKSRAYQESVESDEGDVAEDVEGGSDDAE